MIFAFYQAGKTTHDWPPSHGVGDAKLNGKCQALYGIMRKHLIRCHLVAPQVFESKFMHQNAKHHQGD
ncbi:hypothetical protein D3C86_1649560 [compost metagenome]